MTPSQKSVETAGSHPQPEQLGTLPFMETPAQTSKNTAQNFIGFCEHPSICAEPRPTCFRRLPQGSAQIRASGGSEVVLQLNRSLAEAFSSLRQLQQQHWLDHR